MLKVMNVNVVMSIVGGVLGLEFWKMVKSIVVDK